MWCVKNVFPMIKRGTLNYANLKACPIRAQRLCPRRSEMFCQRKMSTAITANPLPLEQDDPFELSKHDLEQLYADIRQHLHVIKYPELQRMSVYSFDGHGKAFRPVVASLMGRAANVHLRGKGDLLNGQRTLALIAEMIHTASLLHDDVIDLSETRRGKPSAGKLWGQKKSILAGDFILSKTAEMLSRIGCVKTNNYMAQTLVDLVNGEFMQLEHKLEFNDRFAHYIEKSYKKTASLIALTCKSTVTITGGSESMIEASYQYGRNLGIAFQLIDDILDFVSEQNLLGKPAGADLKLGLSTGPVIFACEEFPSLNELVLRKFSQPGDVTEGLNLVKESKGLERTRDVAQAYCNAAVRSLDEWSDSPFKKGLISLADRVLNRTK